MLADRLSADGRNKVLVLEAGRSDYNHMSIRIPACIRRLLRSRYDWQYESQGEKSSNGINVMLHAGKVNGNTVTKTVGLPILLEPYYVLLNQVLGGSSCTNTCIYLRGSAQDYNRYILLRFVRKKSSQLVPMDSANH